MAAEPNPRASAVFWTAFLVVVFVPTAFSVIPRVGVDPTDQVVLLAFASVASLVVPAGLSALILARPLRVHGELGPLLTVLFTILGVAVAVKAAWWLRANPLGEDIGFPVTRELWDRLSWVALLLLPVLLVTLMIDVFLRIIWSIAHALAPVLVPAVALLATLFVAWMLAALILKIARWLQARHAT